MTHVDFDLQNRDITFSGSDGKGISFPSLERPHPVVTFDDETVRSLRDRGEVIVDLRSRTIGEALKSLKSLGNLSKSGDAVFQALRSGSTQIAFNPNRLVIPGSNNMSAAEQLALIEEESAALRQDVPGAKKIMGNAADIYDIIGTAYQEDILLFSQDFNYSYTRTADNYAIGSVTTGNGIRMYEVDQNSRADWLYVAPLTVPIGAKNT